MEKRKTTFIFLGALVIISLFQLGMARAPHYDEEAREAERLEKEMKKSSSRNNPASGFAGGVKQATYDSAKDLISDTAESTATEAPIVGTIEGARVGSGKVLDNTVKGAYKVATLGFGDLESYEVVEPESGSGEPTKIKIKIPGT